MIFVVLTVISGVISPRLRLALLPELKPSSTRMTHAAILIGKPASGQTERGDRPKTTQEIMGRAHAKAMIETIYHDHDAQIIWMMRTIIALAVRGIEAMATTISSLMEALCTDEGHSEHVQAFDMERTSKGRRALGYVYVRFNFLRDCFRGRRLIGGFLVRSIFLLCFW